MKTLYRIIILTMPLAVVFLLITAGYRGALSAQDTTVAESSNITMKTFHDFTVKDINGDDFDLGSLKGKKVLVVNTASECGLTPQYALLQELYEEHGGDKFEIIGFPSNDFGGQEPGSESEIAGFCQKNYGVTFPMMSKVKVKGSGIAPVYQWLTAKAQNGVNDFEVKWNFHKFLVDKDGKLVRDVSPQTLPVDEEVVNWIKE